ncbi:MAG: hypothetical protein AAGJ55_09185 [Cyanobacteria bacterium J06555_12]
MVSSIDDNIRDRAMQAFAREEYSEATQLFEQLTNESPEDLSLKLWLASSQQWSGYPTAARETYESVLAGTDDPDLIGAAQNGLAQLEALQNSGSQDQPERLSTASLPAVDGEFPLLEDSNVNFNLDEPSMTSTNTTSNSSAAETAEIAVNAAESADRPQNSGIIGGPSLDAPNNDFMFDEFDENELFADVSDETSTIIPPIETQIFSNEFGTGDSVSGLEEIVGTPADEAASDQTVFANNDGDIGTLGANMSDDDFAFLEELHDEVGMIDEGSSTHFAAVDDYEFEAEPFTNVDDGSDVVGATLDELPAEDSSNTMIFDSKPETFIPLADDDYAVADDDDNLLLLEDDSEELFDAVDLNNPLESSLESSDAPSAIETAPTSAPQRVDSSTPLGNPAQAAATQGIAILAASTLGFFGLQAVVPSTMIRGIVGAAAGTVAGAGAGLITARQQSSPAP